MYRLVLLFVVLPLLAQLSFNAEAARKKSRKQYFNQIEINAEFDITHPILTANFIGSPEKELLILGENEAQEKVVSVYSYQKESNSYTTKGELVLPAKTIAFDLFTNHKGIKEMLLLGSSELSSLNFESQKITLLSSIDSIYLNPKPQFIVHKKMVKDLNGDKLDDIAIANFSNTNLLTQNGNGEFELSSLPIKANVDMRNSDISFSEAKLFNIDVNFDQLPDIVLIENDQMQAFEQNQTNQFSSISNLISLPKGVSALPWWFVRGADGESIDQSNLEYRMVEKMEDINGDNIVDLMVKQTQSSGVLDRQNNYEIHYGKNVNGLLHFEQEADTVISAEGTLSGLEVLDMNGDGRKEILVSSFDIGVSQIIGALMSGSIDQDVYLFSLNSEDKYDSEPLFSEEVDLNFSLSSGSTGQPVILSADLNGDGFKEIMLSASEKRLSIFTGKDNQELFDSKKLRHRLVLPQDGSMLASSDLNNDKREEVIVRYGKQDDEKLRRKIVILSAK